MDPPTRGPVQVTLQAEWVRERESADQAIDVGGFGVVRAIKQTGTMDFVIPEKLAVDSWLPGPTVQQESVPDARRQVVDQLKPACSDAGNLWALSRYALLGTPKYLKLDTPQSGAERE